MPWVDETSSKPQVIKGITNDTFLLPLFHLDTPTQIVAKCPAF